MSDIKTWTQRSFLDRSKKFAADYMREEIAELRAALDTRATHGDDREQFEAWAKGINGGNWGMDQFSRHREGDYTNSRIEGEWIAWQASRINYLSTPVQPIGWTYECAQPGTEGHVWIEFFSRTKIESAHGVRNIRPVYSSPQLVPDNWQLVPKEPTEAMIHAAEDIEAPRPFGKVYRAMLAAATSQPRDSNI